MGAIATKSLSITTVFAAWDVNMDGAVNVLDMTLVAQDLGQSGVAGWIREDVNSDGLVNILDLIMIGQNETE
jgi:Ca2+-binding EF-hand superfamily protein